MNKHTIGAVVRCGDLVGGVYASVRSLLGGTLAAHAVAVVAERSTPPVADAWLAGFAEARGLRFLRVDADGPGGAWNAGLEAVGPVDFALCLEAGDVVARTALERQAERLSSDPAVRIVTSAIEWIGPIAERTRTEPGGCHMVDLLADVEAVHVSSMFRWADWRSSRGFDASIPALEYADYWLSTLSSGGVVAVEHQPMLQRRVHARALYRRTWAAADYRLALETIVERHRHLAAANLGRLLESGERQSREAHQTYLDARARAQSVLDETGRLTARRRELLADVPADWEAELHWGELGRTTPLSHNWGYDRGTPIDRPLIEQFLAAHADDIRGTVLEIQEDDYTKRFGGARVHRVDVLDVEVTNPRATVIGDLRALDHLATGRYDCIILTQTLHVVDDVPAVLRGCHRILRPGGVLLATLPSASRVCLEYGPEADFWRVTEAGAQRIFADVFPSSAVETTAVGNALVNAAFSFGLSSEELPAGAYDFHDPYLPMVVGVRAVKPVDRVQAASVTPRASRRSGAILMYHRVGACGVDPHRLSISESTFRAQLEWLSQSCVVVPLDELAEGTTPAKPAVALTFDDGYLDNLTVAVPALREMGLPATFFLTTEDGPDPYYYWWDRLAVSLLGSPNLPPTLELEAPSGRRLFDTATDQQRIDAHARIYEEVVRLPASERNSIVGSVWAWADAPTLAPSDRRLSWTEIAELSSPPFSVGAHTVEHLFLPAQPDDALRHELVESRRTLEARDARGRSRVDALAYPFGAFDARIVTAARDAGYRLAVTCVDRAVNDADDPLALPRIEVTEGPLDRFIARLERLSSVSR